MKKAKVIILPLILLAFVLSSVASASESWPGWFKHHKDGTTGGHGKGGGGQTYSVAEPAAVLLLGAGLISLGIYAKRKRGKQR
jgi:hypothetical protein